MHSDDKLLVYYIYVLYYCNWLYYIYIYYQYITSLHIISFEENKKKFGTLIRDQSYELNFLLAPIHNK